MKIAEAVRLDVRPLVASGREPSPLIMATADGIPPGGTLELTAPFEPVPLYPVMRRRGFVGHASVQHPGEWLVTFHQTGIAPATTLTDIVSRAPAAGVVLGSHGIEFSSGDTTLACAATSHGIDLDPLLAELQRLTPG